MLFLTFEYAERTPARIIAKNEQFFCAMEEMWCLPFAAYGKPGSGVSGNRKDRKAVLDTLLRNSGPRDIPSTFVPQFGRFLDINAPLSLVLLAPSDFELQLGTGVKLKRGTLALTHDDVTPPPENWPQWLKNKGAMSHVLFGWPTD